MPLATPRDQRMAKARYMALAMTAPINLKVMERLVRKIKRNCWDKYEGYSLNVPHAGDVLVHLRTPIGRQSIRITESGAMRWFTPEVVFVPELFSGASLGPAPLGAARPEFGGHGFGMVQREAAE